MADQKKLVAEITSMDEDFTQWYTDVVIKAGLIAYSNIKGFMVYKPAGYAIWEAIQKHLDARFKAVGVENVYLPMVIPENLLNKESDLVQGFAPEVAWVTHGGQEELQERICVRPTSETLFSDFYKDEIQSYRDLPRSREFMWQEGHTVHATAEEAQERTEMMLDVYADFCAEDLAIPTIRGQKTEKEKFAGAIATYTIEALMHDGRALQSGTSHNFGSDFAKAYGIQFTDRDNKLKYAYQTSWGMSTRIIGALIMVHGDNSGLVLPPKIAPTQVMVIPIQQRKAGVLDKAREIRDMLAESGFRVKVDETDKSPGFKFAEQEMRGIPLRVEIGPRDIAEGKCVVVRRDTREKISCEIAQLSEKIAEILPQMQQDMYNRALKHLEEHTFEAPDKETFEELFEDTKGFVKAMWCGSRECEEKIKEDYSVTSRCIPYKQEKLSDVCVCCGKPATKMVYWGRAY